MDMEFNTVAELLGENRTFASLLEVSGAVTEINIVSAYGDIKAIKEAYEWACEHQDKRRYLIFRVYVDKSASRFIGNADALSLAELIASDCAETSGIFLVKSTGLFHSKAIVIKSNIETKFAIGSMNFTRRGLKENEEVLLIGSFEQNSRSNKTKKVLDQIENYMSNLTCSSLLEHDSPVSYNGIQDFLLNGFLVYDVKVSEPFGFKLGLPESILAVSSDFSELLSGSIPDILPIDKLIQNNVVLLGVKDAKKHELVTGRWKKYCILTAYGYWSHNNFSQEVNDTIDLRSDARRPHYEWLKKVFNSRKSEIATLIFDHCSEINQYIISLGTGESWSAFENTKEFNARIERFLSRVADRLSTEVFFNRLVRGVGFATVPALYDDVEAADDFERSFVEDLTEKLIKMNSGTKRRINKVASVFYDGLIETQAADIDNFDIDILKSHLSSGDVADWFTKFDNALDDEEVEE